MEVIYIIVGFVCGLVSAFLLFFIQRKKSNEQLITAQKKVEEYQHIVTEKDDQFLAKVDELNNSLLDKTQLKSELKAAERQINQLNDRLEQLHADYKAKSNAYEQLSNQLAEFRARDQERQISFEKQKQLIENTTEKQKKEFENLANQILEAKTQNFKQTNQDSIASLINPVQKEITEFKKRIDEVHYRDTQQRAEISKELEMLQKHNIEITEKADNLTKALQGQKKIQGNWGELMLENVLDSSGLQRGRDYDREPSFDTTEGKRRPDVVVYLPGNKHLIIDAKTSLVAYTNYINAETDTERNLEIKKHATAVIDRIKELAGKEYTEIPDLNSPEVVIMFIPVESAYVEALKYDGTILEKAIERNILVATPTTLLTSLRIVKQLWQFEYRNKHMAELASKAASFHKKLGTFLQTFQEVGSTIDKSKYKYEQALGQLYTGRGNVIKQANEFKQLGVAVVKELPADLVEKGELELNYIPDAADNSGNSNS